MNQPSNQLWFSEIEQKLRQNQLFRRLTDAQMDQINKYSKLVELKTGEILFRHGEQAACFYFVSEGLIKLYRISPNGQEKIIELEKPGRIFAEALMFRKSDRYPVSAAAMQDTTVVAISNSNFLSLIKESMDTALQLMGDLSERLHQMIAEIEHLSLLNGRMRVATYFLDQFLIRGRLFTLEIPKNALASLLALQPESFSRLLRELTDNDIISVDDNKIEVLNDQLLRKYAGIL